jgi:hypothetical protein
MNAFDRAFGKSSPHIEGPIPPQAQNAQERMLASLMSKLIPGFDMKQVAAVGQNFQSAMQYFIEAFKRVEANQATILANQQLMMSSDALILKRLAAMEGLDNAIGRKSGNSEYRDAN